MSKRKANPNEVEHQHASVTVDFVWFMGSATLNFALVLLLTLNWLDDRSPDLKWENYILRNGCQVESKALDGAADSPYRADERKTYVCQNGVRFTR